MQSRVPLLAILLTVLISPSAFAFDPPKLPPLPEEKYRIAEIFDNRLELWVELYATKSPDVVDYATARKVMRVIMQDGEPVYELAAHPFFIWWGRALWKDPEEDGINGNEVIHEKNVIFHATPYLRAYRDQ